MDRPEPFALTEIGFYRGGQRIADALLTDADPGIELRFRLAATASERSIDVRIPINGLDLALDRASVRGGASLRPVR
jgi:phosphatidylserine/phosphatidylglycerophosphate/cardiolipin synthase-like enzyme